jgi:hypothetical protein
LLIGAWPTLPAANCAFCSPIARATSAGVSFSCASRSVDRMHRQVDGVDGGLSFGDAVRVGRSNVDDFLNRAHRPVLL